MIPRRAHRPSSALTLNIIPMIDVIFLLLVFLVLTANLSLTEGVLSTKLPRLSKTSGGGSGTGAPIVPVTPLTITLTPAGTTGCRLIIAGQPVAPADFDQLAAQLAALQYDPPRGRTAGLYKPDDPLLIVPERTVRWQHVVDAVNAVVRAGYTNFAFAELE